MIVKQVVVEVSLKKIQKEITIFTAYTGTNYTDFQKDIETDIYNIALGQGKHFRSCINFYKKLRDKYGDNIILTGHSLERILSKGSFRI